MINDLSRRNFLTRAGGAASAVWLSTHWPAIVAAAEHAHQAAKSSSPQKFEFLTPEEGVEIDAITARIIPSDETPGAHEAGVVYFIDRALTTFALDDQKTYREGLPASQARVRELFPNVAKFSNATPEQQDQVLHSFDDQTGPGRGNPRRRAMANSFFGILRAHTVIGFLVDPDSAHGGNRDGVGWKVIGRDPDHMFQSPFGYYDKDYAGWQPNPPDAEKTKA
ncbi:MAG TPA: gluconate 2-dehydrogenase subunit 3 family protein [Candidatus Acidoferrum sp.]